MFKLFILRLLIYFKGIRFFKSDADPTLDCYSEVDVIIGGGKDDISRKISFHFYEDSYRDYLYKRGKVSKVIFKTQIIRAVFPDDVDEHLIKFNNLKIVFRMDGFLLFDRTTIAKALLPIFIEYIGKELRSSDSLNGDSV